MRKHELVAADIVRQLIPGSHLRPIEPQSNGECDFEIQVGSETFALEVTRSTSQRSERFYAAVYGPDGEGVMVPRNLARHAWLFTVSDLADIRRVRKNVDTYLAAIEASGRESFDVADFDDLPAAAKAIWDDLRVSDGQRIKDRTYTHHCMLLPRDGGSLGADQVIAAVERETGKVDNRRKLGAAGTTQRHLFVFLEHLSYPAVAAMRVCGLPTKPVDLPAEVTHIWVARHSAAEQHCQVWRFDQSAGWQDCGEVSVSLEPLADV